MTVSTTFYDMFCFSLVYRRVCFFYVFIYLYLSPLAFLLCFLKNFCISAFEQDHLEPLRYRNGLLLLLLLLLLSVVLYLCAGIWHTLDEPPQGSYHLTCIVLYLCAGIRHTLDEPPQGSYHLTCIVLYLCAGIRHTLDEPPQGSPHQTQRPPLPHLRWRVRHRILQETGTANANFIFVVYMVTQVART